MSLRNHEIAVQFAHVPAILIDDSNGYVALIANFSWAGTKKKDKRHYWMNVGKGRHRYGIEHSQYVQFSFGTHVSGIAKQTEPDFHKAPTLPRASRASNYERGNPRPRVAMMFRWISLVPE